jgi:hypothetical protein
MEIAGRQEYELEWILEHRIREGKIPDFMEFKKDANMPCHAMHHRKDYFGKDFYMQGLVWHAIYMQL